MAAFRRSGGLATYSHLGENHFWRYVAAFRRPEESGHSGAAGGALSLGGLGPAGKTCVGAARVEQHGSAESRSDTVAAGGGQQFRKVAGREFGVERGVQFTLGVTLGLKNIDSVVARVWRRTTRWYSKIKVAAGAELISTAVGASGPERQPKRVL